MKWRNQNKNLNRNNRTLDSFLSGIEQKRTSQPKKKSNVIPKIKIPPSSGLEPPTKPLHLPFLYPQYPEFREYQYSIAIKCVAENTLVCLPTGLVMILNFHRWFPQGLIFFLAPTKPLVDQQSMSLCSFSQYVPHSQIFSLTGSVPASKRVKAYEKKRIFFCTPQTLENDLLKERLDPKRIVLLIIDQAHKAVGNYSYANIARVLDKQRFGYRLIGLSATPGNDKQRIQEVIENLQIANMIVKSDEDEDVKKYMKKKTVEPVHIQSTAIIREVEQILQQFISWPVNQLLKFRLFDRHLAGGKHGFNSKCFFLINNQINQRLSKLPYKMIHMVQSTKCFLKFLADSLSILREAGYESFRRKFIYEIDQIESEDSLYDKTIPQKSKIHQNFLQLIRQHDKYKRIKQLFQGGAKVVSHPKLQKLRQILYKFLSSKESLERKSKVIIFANLRYTCHEIYKYLSEAPYCEVIRPQIFLGQSKTTVETRDGENTTTETLKLSQKEQINLIKRYKANQINTLISTSIGEQGLDIGEVDAIFCYEGGMSTIRMVQRMGRTGRKRDGSVFVLLMEGKEVEQFEKANKKTQRIKKTKAQNFKYYSFNPVLFEELSQIPIHFFDKPPEEKIEEINNQEEVKEESSETKRKMKMKCQIDRKQTKKKQAELNNLREQASNSQDNAQQSYDLKNKQESTKHTKQKQLFKINGQACTRIKNNCDGQIDQNQDDQISVNSKQDQQVQDMCARVSDYQEQSISCDGFSEGSLSCDEQHQSRRVYDKFDSLFNFDQPCEDQAKGLSPSVQEQSEASNIKSKNKIINNIQDQQITILPPNTQTINQTRQEGQTSQRSSLDEIFQEYHRAKRNNQGCPNSKQNEDSHGQSSEGIENVSENSSQIIDQQERMQSLLPNPKWDESRTNC